MKAQESGLSFLKTDMKLEIPYFQRAYVWEEKNWEELFENLIDEKQSHFLGSIILKRIETLSGEIPRFSVIDGQQRLTTLSILLKASYDNIDISQLEQEIYEEVKTTLRVMLYYRENELSKNKFAKIIHSRLDAKDYISVINGDVQKYVDSIVLDSEASKVNPASESRILKCYKYFNKRLSNDNELAAKIWRVLVSATQKLLVKIDLETNENEQAIFDSVNSSGVRLTGADTIKNTLFQKMMELVGGNDDNNEVINLYTESWEKTFTGDTPSTEYWSNEQRIGRISRDNLELLLHCVALIKGFFDPDKHNMLDLSDVYKNYIAKMSKDDLVVFIKEIADYGVIYRRVFTYDNARYKFCDNIQRLFHILKTCDISTLNSYVLYLLKRYPADSNGNLPQPLLNELRNIEKMVIRYTLCKVSNKNFNKLCVSFIRGTRSVTEEMLSNQNFINDYAIKNALCNIPNNKIATLLLFWMELYRRSKDSRYEADSLEYSFSLEHIMPQSWEEHWGINAVPVVTAVSGVQVQNEEEAKELRRAAIYEIGNMTILKKRLNSAMSNSEIKIKLMKMEEFASTGIAKEVIKIVKCCNAWNEKTIRDRTNELYKLFIELWPADFTS